MRIGKTLVVALTLLASACGDGDDTITASPDGLLVGTVTRAGQAASPVLALVRNGRILAIDRNAGVFYDGTFTRDGSSLASSAIRVYAGNTFGATFIRGYTETASLSATVGFSGWSGTITRPSSTETLSLGFDTALYGQDSHLAFTQGTWSFSEGQYTSTLVIAADGTTSSSNNLNNCVSGGSVAIINAAYNLYASQTTVSGTQCATGVAGAYSGFITLAEDVNPLDTLIVLLAKADVFQYGIYTRQP